MKNNNRHQNTFSTGQRTTPSVCVVVYFSVYMRIDFHVLVYISEWHIVYPVFFKPTAYFWDFIVKNHTIYMYVYRYILQRLLFNNVRNNVRRSGKVSVGRVKSKKIPAGWDNPIVSRTVRGAMWSVGVTRFLCERDVSHGQPFINMKIWILHSWIDYHRRIPPSQTVTHFLYRVPTVNIRVDLSCTFLCAHYLFQWFNYLDRLKY